MSRAKTITIQLDRDDAIEICKKIEQGERENLLRRGPLYDSLMHALAAEQEPAISRDGDALIF